MQSVRTRWYKIVVLIILFLTLGVIGAAGIFIFKSRSSLDNRGKAETDTATQTVDLYFEPVQVAGKNNSAQVNVFADSGNIHVSGVDLWLTMPNPLSLIDGAAFKDSIKQANDTCRNNGFKLVSAFTPKDVVGNSIHLTRYYADALKDSDGNYLVPSGKFCVGTITFKLDPNQTSPIQVSFDKSAIDSGDMGAAGVESKLKAQLVTGKDTLSITPERVIETSPSPSPSPTVTSSPSPSPSRTPSTSPSKSPTPTASRGPQSSTTPTNPSNGGGGTSSTGTPGDGTGGTANELPDTLYQPFNSFIIAGLGTLLITIAAIFYQRKYNSRSELRDLIKENFRK